MDGRRVGSILRAVRLQRRLRQRDVAQLAALSQSTVSRAERGQLDRLSFDQLDQVAKALRVSLYLSARWLDGDADALVDRDHAAIVEWVVSELAGHGWTTEVELGFNHFGDRGSVDVVGWHPGTRILVIVEVKSRLTDLQATFAAFQRKVRIVPGVVERDRGWQPLHVGRVLVMPGTSRNRATVARHASMFDTSFPERSPAVRAWLRQPAGDVGGVWFLSSMPGRTRKHVIRVRKRPAAPPQSPGDSV